MNTFVRATRWSVCGTCALLAISANAQQLTTPFVANSANSAVNEILMDPPTISQVNTSQNVHAKLTSITARPEYQFSGSQVTDVAVNLYGTDQARGHLIEWIEPTDEAPVPPAILWQPAFLVHPAAGSLRPSSPTGISSDPAGNLFVVHSTNTTQAGSVWVFRGQELNGPAPPQPRVIDRVAGDTVSIAGLLEETVIAPVSEEGVSAGDLLVLSRSPAMVLVYHLNGPHGVADILADDCVNCGTDVEPDVVISGSVQVDMPGTSPDVPFSSFDPTGMDFYGDDLLIATGRGEIVRIDLDLLANPVPGFSAATIFRQGLGNGKSRIKTGFQGGSAAVFVTNQNRGSLMRFRNEGAIVDEVTGLQNPEGLAVSIAAFEPVANCIVGSVTNPGTGCDPSVNDDTFPVGGVSRVFEQQISSLTGAAPGSGVSVAPNSNVLQDFCVASANAVSAVLDDLVPGESPTIEKFCPGWGAEVNPVIPPELVHEGFPLVFVKTTAPGLVITHGLVQTESDEANLIPGFVDSQQCPYYRTAWAPSDVGDNAVAEDGDGNPVFEENLTGCGSLLRLGRGGSFHMIGPFTLTDEFNDETVNLDDLLRTFVLAKFDRLELVMAATHSSPGRLMSQIDKCVATARRTYERANNAQKLSSALADLAKCDTLVTGTTAGQLTSTAYRNPGGDMLWRIRNIAFTIREHAGL